MHVLCRLTKCYQNKYVYHVIPGIKILNPGFPGL